MLEAYKLKNVDPMAPIISTVPSENEEDDD
jgi:hypothetical protein